MAVTLPLSGAAPIDLGPQILRGTSFCLNYGCVGINKLGVLGTTIVLTVLTNQGVGIMRFRYTELFQTAAANVDSATVLNNFDNATMYPLIVLILVASVAINTVLTRWEHTLLARRGLR